MSKFNLSLTKGASVAFSAFMTACASAPSAPEPLSNCRDVYVDYSNVDKNNKKGTCVFYFGDASMRNIQGLRTCSAKQASQFAADLAKINEDSGYNYPGRSASPLRYRAGFGNSGTLIKNVDEVQRILNGRVVTRNDFFHCLKNTNPKP